MSEGGGKFPLFYIKISTQFWRRFVCRVAFSHVLYFLAPSFFLLPKSMESVIAFNGGQNYSDTQLSSSLTVLCV